MENHNKQNLDSLKTGSIIGRLDYNKLRLKPNLTDDEKASMALFEEMQRLQKEGELKMSEYLRNITVKERQKVDIDPNRLFKYFKIIFKSQTGIDFNIKDDVAFENFKTILFYFCRDKRFFEQSNLTRFTEPSFDKGLLVIGGYGNGKTTIFKCFEILFKNVYGYTFKGVTTNDVVTMYEGCENETQLKELFFMLKTGDRYFDDLLTEREASRYGKVNVMKEVLEKRYSWMQEKHTRTYCSMNFSDSAPGDVELALEEIGNRYGGRVYDRVMQMFNVVVFNGKSFRR